MPSSRSTQPPPSSLGPFRLISRLGQGGFAPVFRAEEVYEGRKLRDVAIKLFFLPDELLADSPDALRWHDGVIDEARALCRVEHPNIVRFHALSRDDAQGIVGLVMEYIPGRNLGVILSTQGPFAEPKVLEVGTSIAWALAAVHNAGLVHRDVKPENIIEAASGYKLIDFGIVAEESPPASIDGEPPLAPRLMGTPGYVAPEHRSRGVLPSPAGDLYALGVTLFVLATGRMPPPGAADLLASRERAPASLLELTSLLLDPDPNARPRHADWVARELERLRSGIAPPSAPSVAHTPMPEKDTRASAADPALGALLDLERRVPEPLLPLFVKARRACQEDGANDPGEVLGELGLGVLRYAFALGMALLAAAPGARLTGALAAQVRAAAQPSPLHVTWRSLLRALHQALRALDPPSGRLLAFTEGSSLADRFRALFVDGSPTTEPSASTRWLAGLFEDVAELLTIPLVVETPLDAACQVDERAEPARIKESYAVFGDRRIRLDPWLSLGGGRLLLPEVPAAPGKPWRTADPISGERRDAPLLDEAIRRLLGDEAKACETVPELDRCPPLVGRADALALLGRTAREAMQGSVRLVLLTGPLGVGRTRLLDAAVAQAGVAPERTIRSHGSPERQGSLRPLLVGLRALPKGGDAFRLLEGAIERALSPAVLPAAQQADDALEAVEDALLLSAAEEPVVLAIDDIQWADERTLKLLQLLVERADRGARSKLLVLAAARDEPNAGGPLRALLGAVRGRALSGARHVALGPLSIPEATALAQAVCPLEPALERAVVWGSGRVPFFLVNALLVWRETDAIVWRKTAFCAADEELLARGVSGVAALVEARLASYFVPNSPLWHASLRALAAVALHGGGLPLGTLLRAIGEDASVDAALEALVDAGILVTSGEQPEYGFAQEMVRQAVQNLVRPKPWFYRLHGALLDAIAAGPGALADAAFLAAGYEKLGNRDEARAWLGRAMDSAVRAGLFGEAMGFGDRLAALAEGPAARADVEIAVVRALVFGRQFEEANERLARHTPGALRDDPCAAAQDLRWRILRLEVARGRSEPAADPALLADADALAFPALACEARIALAGVAPEAQAMELIGAAIELAGRLGPALEFSARVLRVELIYAASLRDLHQVERDLGRALSIAHATSSIWQQIHIEGDLAVLEAELGRADAAVERLRRLAEQAEARGMRGQLRTLLHNLSTCLMREGRAAEAAEVALRTVNLAVLAGDPTVQGIALSLRAYALFCTGELEAALASASEAEWLQRERDDRMRAQTLLRRAAILEAMGREDEALEDARAAQETAEWHGERGFFVTAVLWEKLALARRGEVTADELREALAAVEASGVGQRALTRRLIEQATAWLAGATASLPP